MKSVRRLKLLLWVAVYGGGLVFVLFIFLVLFRTHIVLLLIILIPYNPIMLTITITIIIIMLHHNSIKHTTLAPAQSSPYTHLISLFVPHQKLVPKLRNTPLKLARKLLRSFPLFPIPPLQLPSIAYHMALHVNTCPRPIRIQIS